MSQRDNATFPLSLGSRWRRLPVRPVASPRRAIRPSLVAPTVLLSGPHWATLVPKPARPAPSKGGPRANHAEMSYVQGRTASWSHWLLQRSMLPESDAHQALARAHCRPSTPATRWPQALAARPSKALYAFVSSTPLRCCLRWSCELRRAADLYKAEIEPPPRIT